jgi:hypothetical protein
MTKEEILRDLDIHESRLYTEYSRIQALRLRLQEQWRTMPDGSTWSQAKHDESNYIERSTRRT